MDTFYFPFDACFLLHHFVIAAVQTSLETNE